MDQKQQDQITQGVLKTSYRNSHATVLKKTSYQQQEIVEKFLNENCQDLVIQQRLTPDKAEGPLTKGTFFISTYSARIDPGYLVFLPNQIPVFVRYNLTKREREMTKGHPICYNLRMRVSAEINEGSVLIASLDVN